MGDNRIGMLYLAPGLVVLIAFVGSALAALFSGEWRYLIITGLCYLGLRGKVKG